MNIMRLVFSNFLLYLALGARFNFTDGQETTETRAHIITTTAENDNTVGETLSSESTIAGLVNTVTELQTKRYLHHQETTHVYQMSTMLEEPTTVNPLQLNTEIEQTTAKFTPEITTPAKIEQTTMITTNVPTNVETTVAEQITSDAPSTHQYDTTKRNVGFTTSELTSPTEHPAAEITTVPAMATDSTEALNLTFIMSQPPADLTASPSNPVETSIITTTATLISSSRLSQITPEGPSHSTFDDESVSTHFASVTTGNVQQSFDVMQTNGLLIIIVCVTTIPVLCAALILLVIRRKKHTSQTFGPMYVNGQSKRSKKKKGAEADAWAGPVNLEAGVECDAEVQEGLLPDHGKQNENDMVLSTFAALDEGGVSNGGVGGEGTKEAKKWEEQEPLLYIDEDVNENKAGKTLEENKTQKGDDKSEEKELNGGETFCLTTAV